MVFDDWKEKSVGLVPDKTLLWDVDQSKLDFHKMRKTYVQRVIERGSTNHFYAAIRFYGGIENFVSIIKEVHYLSDRNIDFICTVFDVKKEELGCYIRQQLRKEHLGSLEI
jgi:hypothetical protein